mgnify:CR=1 FL=1
MAKKRRISPTGVAILILVAIAVLLVGAAGFYTDLLWYKQLGFTDVFTTHIWTEVLVGVASFAITGGLSAISIWLAYRNRPIYVQSPVADRLGLGQYRDQIIQSSRAVLIAVPILLGLFSAGATSGNWQTVLLYLNRTASGQTDPQFHLDVSFYLFELPLYNGVVALLQAAILISLVAAALIHTVFGGVRLAPRLTFTKAARVQLAVTAALAVAVEAVSLWLDQYHTMTSASGLYTGATFSDVNAKIPGFEILAGIGVIVAVLFLVTAFIGKWRVSILATGLMVVSSVILIGIYPWGVQTFQVVPNERLLEAEFIKRNIEATRFAYGLDQVQSVDYNAKTTADAGALRTDAETTAQIRIIDPSLVSASFRQLEQYRQYYNFGNHLDVDRYQLDGKSQDTVIAVRELNQSGLGNSQSWFNDVIVYTHGYGLVAAYGNQRSIDGQPVFFQAGIPSTGKLGTYEPRIYFGESSPTYSIVGGTKNAKPQELDYPAGTDGDQQTYTTFTGDGGPKLDNFVTRLAYALKFRSEQILLSDAINNNSQILYKRSPLQRVQAAAPYLQLDSDTYPAVVDGRVVWVVDGYTTSDQYPYSRSESPATAVEDSNTGRLTGDNSINYIRNSVKATVDAYDGKVTLYAWDTKDPVLKTWQKAFPTSLKPVSAMSAELLSHVRYPTDLFKIQRNMLGAYHVTEAGAFYSQQDAWMVPNDPSSDTNSSLAQPPYYLTMQVPGSSSPAFSLYSTFIPRSTGESSRNVLTGYLVADSDAGSTAGKVASSYGKLSLLVLPRDTVVPGPGQVQNNFNADSEVSKLLNLLRQGSTEVLNGNLLTLPVGGGLLYVQPVYIKSTGETSFPLLKKVLVAFGDQIAFEDSLDLALNKLFGGESGASAGDGTGTGTGGGSGTGTTGTTSNQALNNALVSAKQALADKAQAMADGDWKAYGEADKRLADAIAAAIRASGGK